MPRAWMVVDYQNIHLTGHGLWCPAGESPHLCLVHPLHFANQAVGQRNLLKRLAAKRIGRPFESAVLDRVVTFRGLPSNRHNPNGYRRSQAQRSEWTRDPRSVVRYRPLKYYDSGKVQEKGVDVMIALELVQAAAIADRDDLIVILAAHDTDQEPALELAAQLAGERIETAGWHGAKRLAPHGQRMWHTALHADHFARCRDTRDYR